MSAHPSRDGRAGGGPPIRAVPGRAGGCLSIRAVTDGPAEVRPFEPRRGGPADACPFEPCRAGGCPPIQAVPWWPTEVRPFRLCRGEPTNLSRFEPCRGGPTEVRPLEPCRGGPAVVRTFKPCRRRSAIQAVPGSDNGGPPIPTVQRPAGGFPPDSSRSGAGRWMSGHSIRTGASRRLSGIRSTTSCRGGPADVRHSNRADAGRRMSVHFKPCRRGPAYVRRSTPRHGEPTEVRPFGPCRSSRRRSAHPGRAVAAGGGPPIRAVPQQPAEVRPFKPCRGGSAEVRPFKPCRRGPADVRPFKPCRRGPAEFRPFSLCRGGPANARPFEPCRRGPAAFRPFSLCRGRPSDVRPFKPCRGGPAVVRLFKAVPARAAGCQPFEPCRARTTVVRAFQPCRGGPADVLPNLSRSVAAAEFAHPSRAVAVGGVRPFGPGRRSSPTSSRAVAGRRRSAIRSPTWRRGSRAESVRRMSAHSSRAGAGRRSSARSGCVGAGRRSSARSGCVGAGLRSSPIRTLPGRAGGCPPIQAVPARAGGCQPFTPCRARTTDVRPSGPFRGGRRSSPIRAVQQQPAEVRPSGPFRSGRRMSAHSSRPPGSRRMSAQSTCLAKASGRAVAKPLARVLPGRAGQELLQRADLPQPAQLAAGSAIVRPPVHSGGMTVQTGFDFKTRGGVRRGAGRKRRAPRPQVPHRARPVFSKAVLHVTCRVRREIWNLRTHRCFRAVSRALEQGCVRFGFRLVHFSVQGNHFHFIVEAPDEVALGRAMKGLEVRMARRLNRVLRRRGPVFSDRYHARRLRSPREVSFAVRYAVHNFAEHARRDGRPVRLGFVDPYSSAALPPGSPLVARPHDWLLLRWALQSLPQEDPGPVAAGPRIGGACEGPPLIARRR